MTETIPAPAPTLARQNARQPMAARLRPLPLPALTMLTLLLTAAPATAETTLRGALDQAWERAVSARVAETRRGEAAASRTIARSVLPEAPLIGVAGKSQRFTADRGGREFDLEVALPLWLSGQRAGREQFAERDSADAETGIAATRLALAGALRTAVWNLATARAEAGIAGERLATAENLEAEILRRQRAGELARTDLLLAQEETLAARGNLAQARTRASQAQNELRLLTGLDELPRDIEEPVRTASGPHARLAFAEAALERARAGLDVVRQDRRNPPELAVGLVQARDDFASATTTALRFGLRVPLGSEARNAPRLAAANSQLVRAEAELRQTLAEIEAEQRAAQAALGNAAAAHAAAQTRATLAGERQALLQKAFALGELGLAEFMRVRAAANEARLDLARAQQSFNAARAQLNQARGILP